MGSKKKASVGAASPARPAKQKVSLFYASKDKFERAVKLAGAKGSVRKEYEKLGGSFTEGYGYAPVEK
jgi:hypothetical protein